MMNEKNNQYFSEKWWISPFNFDPEVQSRLNLPDRVLIRDSTIREGEETPGVHYSLENKLEIVKRLEEIGVTEIDCGYVGAVQEHWDLAREIKDRGYRIRTYSHLGSSPVNWNEEITKTAGAEIDYLGLGVVLTQWQLDLFAPKNVTGVTPEVMISLIPSMVDLSIEKGMIPILDCVDATRTSIPVLKEAVQAGVECGVQKIILYDTVGACFPEAIRFMVRKIKHVSKGIPLGIHVHDDFGLGCASTLAAVEEGAEMMDLVVNKLGDRAGNSSFEEVIVALEILYGIKTGIKMEKLYELSKLVEQLSGILIPPNKPVVGENTFLHESELHAMSVIATDKFWMCFTPYKPELVGQSERVIFGPTTLHGEAIRKLCESLGLENYEEVIPKILEDLRDIISEKKYAEKNELIQIINRHVKS